MVEAHSTMEKALLILKEAEQFDILTTFPSKTKQEQHDLAEQVIHLDKVTPGGLKDYVMRARRFLEDSKNNVNPFENYTPEIPQGVFLQPGTEEMNDMEDSGLKELPKLGIVLIAGGLGERLGYSGIKIGLPVCTIEEDYTYLKYYTQYVHALRERALQYLDSSVNIEEFYIPFCIMVSDDTETRTVQLLEAHDYFGLKKEHVSIVKQENVPALLDNAGNIALSETGFKIITKPHGHGDIHSLLYQHGVAQKWVAAGKEWMIFIQDTNALALKTIPSILGVSKKFNFEMNTVTVRRMPGEAMGAICRLVDQTNEGQEIVINVEYNQLGPLLKEKWEKGGDVANAQGYSYFPGNTNTLVFKLKEYLGQLEQSKGVIPEFVNPKYADEHRNKFKAPTRLECMMQDYPKLLTSKGAVGFTSYENWYCFSPAKNNLKDAADCAKRGLPSYGASSAEYDFYNWTNEMLIKAGVNIQKETDETDYNGIKIAFGPKILMDPTFAITFKEIQDKFRGGAHITTIGKGATLVLKGKDTIIENALIDGVHLIHNGEHVTGEHSNSKQVIFQVVGEDDHEIYRIRGYKPHHQ